MGIVLSAVVGAVGAVELVSVLHYISDEWLLHQLRTQSRDKLDNALSKYEEEIRKSIAELGRRDSESTNYMIDGVAYENGFRLNDEPVNEELRLKFEQRLKQILQESNLGTATRDEEGLASNKYEITQVAPKTEKNKYKKDSAVQHYVKSEMAHDPIQDNNSIINGSKLVECVEPFQLQREIMRESIENEIEIIMPEKCTSNENVESLSNNQNRKYFTTGNDIESATEIVYEISNKIDENIQHDSSTFPPIHFDEYDRPSQVDDDYLHSLDGVKNRPLVRDDGTGRRRAFKKRSPSSSLSQELKSSREEELKMFTSLEDAEFASMKNDFVPIKYSSEPNMASTSSPSISLNSSVKSNRYWQKHRSISNTNIAEMDEENDENESEKTLSILHSDDVTHPWGDKNLDSRRDLNLQTHVSIEEEPELNLSNPTNVAISDEFETTETKSQYRKANSRDETTMGNHQHSPTETRTTTDRHVSMDDNNFPPASVNANTPAIIAITNATTINITNNNTQFAPALDASAASITQTDKFDVLTNRLQRIEQAIEQKISDWSQIPHQLEGAIKENDTDNGSDEEPDYSLRKTKIGQKLDYNQVEIDFQKILEDNEIEFNEDTSYLPKLTNRHFFHVVESDEEPHFKYYSSNNESSDTTELGSVDYSDKHKGHHLRKHKRHDDRIYYESDEEPYYGLNRLKKQKQHSSQHDDKQEAAKHKRITDRMCDELSDTTDDVFTSTVVIETGKELLLNSDEETFLKIESKSSDDLPTFCKFKEHVIATVVLPQLGLVRTYTYDSDEEPYYLEKRISFDEQSRGSTLTEANREDNIFDEYKQRLYDEYEIEENDENITYSPKLSSHHLYSWESDEEPYYDEKRLIKEHQRRSKSPSRSPPIRANNENMLAMAMTQNFLDLEREIEQEDRSSHSKTRDNVIHLGLLGNSHINTTKHYEDCTETSTENIVEITNRRKYKWEEKVVSTITSYYRGELKTAPPNLEDYKGGTYRENYLVASEEDTTQPSGFDQKLKHLQSNHESIDDINDEEVAKRVQLAEEKISDISENLDEGAVGGSDDPENVSSRARPKSDDLEKMIESSKENETFHTILSYSEEGAKQTNDELNCFPFGDSDMIEFNKNEKGDLDASLNSRNKELRTLEDIKTKEKKHRAIKKKKKSIGEKIDSFIKLEHSDQNESSLNPTEIIIKETKELRSITEFDRSQVYDEFLLNEKQENVEQATAITPTDTAKADNFKINTHPSKCQNEQQPNIYSAESNPKRKSISRPDPLYLLKESMYPFY